MSRQRRIGSIKKELVQKSREAALATVQVFNNPLITFKSEMFIVNMHIAWTYLLHAYYREKGVEYRYVEGTTKSGRRIFGTTKFGAHKYWALEDCLNSDQSPVEKDVSNNLRFLIGLRHEIEHQMTTRIDDALSARFQACCINYNELITKLFGEDNGIEKYLSFSLQFSSINEEQTKMLDTYKDILPSRLTSYVQKFDESLSPEEFNSPKFAYRVIYTQKVVNHPGQADRVIEFIDPKSEAAKKINVTYASIKEKEKTKYRASTIVSKMQSEGYSKFKMYSHTKLWKKNDGKNPSKGFGVSVEGYWYWYESWLDFVRQYCKKNKRKLI